MGTELNNTEEELDYDQFHLDQIWKEIAKGEAEHARLVRKSNRRLMRVIKHVLGNSFHRSITAYLNDLKNGCNYPEFMLYELVNKTTGQYQEENWGKHLKGVWCQQWSSGCEGDSWGGYVYIKLRENKYLRVNYSM